MELSTGLNSDIVTLYGVSMNTGGNCCLITVIKAVAVSHFCGLLSSQAAMFN